MSPPKFKFDPPLVPLIASAVGTAHRLLQNQRGCLPQPRHRCAVCPRRHRLASSFFPPEEPSHTCIVHLRGVSAEELMHTLILNHIMHTLILHTLNSYQGVTDDNPIHARAGCEIMTAISCMCSPFQKLELKYTSEKILDSPFHLMS